MNEQELLNLADIAFQAIKKNTGILCWSPRDGLSAAFGQFEKLYADKGLVWIINSASGTGLSHFGLMTWMEEAKKIIPTLSKGELKPMNNQQIPSAMLEAATVQYMKVQGYAERAIKEKRQDNAPIWQDAERRTRFILEAAGVPALLEQVANLEAELAQLREYETTAPYAFTSLDVALIMLSEPEK